MPKKCGRKVKLALRRKAAVAASKQLSLEIERNQEDYFESEWEECLRQRREGTEIRPWRLIPVEQSPPSTAWSSYLSQVGRVPRILQVEPCPTRVRVVSQKLERAFLELFGPEPDVISDE